MVKFRDWSAPPAAAAADTERSAPTVIATEPVPSIETFARSDSEVVKAPIVRPLAVEPVKGRCESPTEQSRLLGIPKKTLKH